jgi:hypothetical protein
LKNRQYHGNWRFNLAKLKLEALNDLYDAYEKNIENVKLVLGKKQNGEDI